MFVFPIAVFQNRVWNISERYVIAVYLDPGVRLPRMSRYCKVPLRVLGAGGGGGGSVCKGSTGFL